MQPALFPAIEWTVSGLTRRIRDLLESDMELQDVWVKGEISNLSRPGSGHVYFTLKDAGSSLRCVIWRADASQLEVPLQEGMAVAAHGRVGIYEVSGQYQLYVDQVHLAGEGVLYQEFLRLKSLLEAEGLFDPERKRPIPELPGRIGIVTSPTGAALRDMLSAIRRRLPLAEVILAPTPVQGEEAPLGIVGAIDSLNRLEPVPDVILLGRGGGSIEDLWAFNDERVVRAVTASKAPLVCGVGHETDFTLSDFAADLRAPTPTAAAELATPITLLDLKASLASLTSNLLASGLERIGIARTALAGARDQLRYYSPVRLIRTARQLLDETSRRSVIGQTHRLALETSRLAGLGKRLEALSPRRVLARGYAVVTRRSDGALIHQVSQAVGGIRIRVSDGEFDAEPSTRR